MKKLLATTSLLILTSVGMAQTPQPTAVEHQSQFAERFRRADTNGDGVISESEARAAGLLKDDFYGIDADHNGTVSLFELSQAMQKKLGQWMSDFDAADTNHDGKLSQEEIKHAPGVEKMLSSGDRPDLQNMSRPEFESYALDRLYRNSELPSVAPNIIEKKF
ncbi:MAG TPA: hypothetical protein VMT89_03110 [Candidatus Acidoferrales bacterium]|nr:hypothetical protein [Candidatus Acidoferrales bacterium]